MRTKERERMTTVQPELLHSLGKLIARSRKRAGLTQKHLHISCTIFGCPISEASIARIEKGTRDISFYEFEVIDRIIHIRNSDEFKELMDDYITRQQGLHN